MTYVIVDTATGQKYRKRSCVCDATYETERGAKTAATKLNKKYSPTHYEAMDCARTTSVRALPKGGNDDRNFNSASQLSYWCCNVCWCSIDVDHW